MCDPGVRHVAGAQLLYVLSPAFFLRRPAREHSNRIARIILLKSGYDKADRPVHAGNIPGGALPNAQSALFPGNQSFHAAQIHQQIVEAVTN